MVEHKKQEGPFLQQEEAKIQKKKRNEETDDGFTTILR
jgi:hypothetical protein